MIRNNHSPLFYHHHNHIQIVSKIFSALFHVMCHLIDEVASLRNELRQHQREQPKVTTRRINLPMPLYTDAEELAIVPTDLVSNAI